MEAKAETPSLKGKRALQFTLQFILVVAVLLLALVVLTPRQWEPSQENWHKWAAARILRETGDFPALAMGPLYVTYLLLFSPIQYPWSVTIEYVITHLFVYLAIYLLLQCFVRRTYAVLLTIAWIPHLAVVEPGGAILGIGFMCLYLIPGKSSLRNQGYLPPALLCAALSHTVYLLFLGGHLLGRYWETRRLPLAGFKAHLSGRFLFENKVIGCLTIALVAFALLTIVSSKMAEKAHPEQNHILMDPTYVPIALDNPIKTAFFVLGTERYVRRTFPKDQWVYQDWYISTPQAYGGGHHYHAGLCPQARDGFPESHY